MNALPVRLICLGLLTLAGLATAPLSAGAQSGPSPTPDACLGRSDVLGLSRIVEIDTEFGPRFGEQYEENIFLEPGEVVLTFDDGPLRRLTKPILDILDKHCTKATFFAVGRMAAADPEMLREIDRRGHTIGSHTWSHKKLGRNSQATAKREIELGISALTGALGKPIAPFFRFPYLSDPKRVQTFVQKRKHGIFGIDIDSRDFKTRSGDAMRKRVLAALKKKGRGIILFHDIQRSTRHGLDSLLKSLKANGYKVVHMIPKTNARTVAVYDKIAAKRIKRKAQKKASSPLADRAVTWPNSDSATDDELPWIKKPTPKKNQAARRRVSKPKPPPQTPSVDRWQMHPFGR